MKSNISIKVIGQIAATECTKILTDSRIIMVLVVIIMGYQNITIPLIENSRQMDGKIHLLEPYIALVNSKFLVYFLNFPVFTGFPAHQHLCNLHFSLIFSLVRKL